uniref:Sterile alpha motif domain containing 4B n=1 Tax=Eptatretus burgeri TaxID=7764 RepID=A0A8C4N2G6_EPTBU
MMFRDQVGVLSSWFKAWNECEQTVALLSLLKRVSRTQARFLQLCLDHSLAACTELQSLEREANDPAYVGQWWQESHNKAMALLLSHFPLLKPSNVEAKAQYMRLLPKVLAHCIESGQQVEESRQLLSYALIHPAISMEDRGALAGWFSHLEDRVGTMGASTSFSPEQEAPPPPPHLDWLSQGPPFPSSTGTSVGGDTVSLPPHAPLSPQSSVASSGSGGSELADDFISIPGSGRNTFREEGSGMKDVPAWLKSLRLHKYARLFSQLTYPEMMSLTEQKLETQV